MDKDDLTKEEKLRNAGFVQLSRHEELSPEEADAIRNWLLDLWQKIEALKIENAALVERERKG